MRKNGFTLFEAMLAVGILGTISTGYLFKIISEREQNRIASFYKDANDIVQAVDHRIAIDGYDPNLWQNLKWNNEEEVVNNLIKGDLTSKNLVNCPNGKWNPSINSESKTVLLNCNLWENRRKNNESMTAEIKTDSSGFIQNFELIIGYDNSKDFEKSFQDIIVGMKHLTSETQEIAGKHSRYFISKSTGNKIQNFECSNNFDDCAIKFSFNRSGGNEYIRADGQNSMINDHLSFIESKGDSPLKCVRWSNTIRDGSGTWSREVDEDCGIGIYEKVGQPVMVETVTDTGTFKNILLDQNCIYYRWNGSDVINTGTTKPCGMSNDGTEIYQVIPNISVDRLDSNDIYTNIIHTKSLIAETITGNTLEAIDNLKTDLIESYSLNGTITVDSNMTLEELLSVNGAAYFNNNTYFNEEASFAKNVNVYGSVNVVGDTNLNNGFISGQQFFVNDIKIEDSSCSTNGSLSRKSDGTLLNCISGQWKPLFKDSVPAGTIVAWGKGSIPSGWIELNGQSTSGYPKLSAIYGSRVPDFRGYVLRALDRGRGIDSEPYRALLSIQGDAIRNITGENYGSGGFEEGAKFRGAFYTTGLGTGGPGSNADYKLAFDASRVVPTAAENRVKSIAVIYIIKAE